MPKRENSPWGRGSGGGLGLQRAIKLSKKEKGSSQMMAWKKGTEEEKETGCLMQRNVHGAGKMGGSDTQRSLLSGQGVWSSSVGDETSEELREGWTPLLKAKIKGPVKRGETCFGTR